MKAQMDLMPIKQEAILKKIRGKVLFQFLICLIITFCSTGALALGTGFIPAANRADMVYDDARGVLYITSGSAVLRYKLATNSFLNPYTFNLGSLSGIDLSPDGDSLAVADGNITGIHLIDLKTDTIKPDLLFTPEYGEGGSFTVAYGYDGSLLVTMRYNGSGHTPLRRVDPQTGAVKVIQSSVYESGMLAGSADGKCIAHVQDVSNGPLSLYDVATQQISKTAQTYWYNYEVGANRNCTQFAVPTYGGTFIYDDTFNKTGTVGVYAGGQPIGVAYHPSQDIVYFAWAQSSKVRAYNSNTSEHLASFDAGYNFQHTGNGSFNQGRLKISRDGTLLFVTVADGVYCIKTALNPVADDQSLATNSAAGMAVTLSGSSPRGIQLSYSVVTQPAHGTLQGTPPNLTYTPQATYSGQDIFTFKVSDGTLESPPATVAITIDKETPEVTAFAMPASSSFLSVPVASFSATDNVAVTGYCLTESTTASACQWSATPPASYHFSGIGPKTLYAFARDTAGNISDPASAAVNIPEIVPLITTFSIPPSYGYRELTIPVSLSATDDFGITGYCLSESGEHSSCYWTSWPPTSYTFSVPGPHTLYAFARNSTGKVSAPATASTNVVGQVNFIPASSRTDMVHDSARDVVYITNGSSVLRYKLGTQTFLAPYTFAFADLAGIDISSDGDTLAVADRNMIGVHLVDLRTDTIREDLFFTPSSGESGTHSVAFGADGTLLVTSRFSGSGWVPLRRVDPATLTVSVIDSMINQDSMLSASGDRKCIAFEESNSSAGPVSIYDVASKTVTRTVRTDWFTYEIGANRDCTQIAVPTYGGTFIYDSSLTKIGTVGVYAGKQPIGVAYSPASDLVYFAWTGTREVRSYDTGNYQQLASYDVGYTFQNNGNYAYDDGRIKVSRDGSLFLVTVDGGIRYQRISSGAPIADDQAVTAYSGSPLPVTLTGSNSGQSPLSYSVTVQPSHGTLQGSAPNLIYTPAAGYSGLDSFSFKVSDGTRESNVATFALTIKPVPANVATAPPTVKGSLSLSWNNPSDPDFSHIHIYRSSSAGTPGVLIADNITGSSYTDTGLASLTTFYYMVRWVDSSGLESTNSNQVSQRTLDAAPPVTLATPGQGGYRLTQSVTLSCNDGNGDGCATTYYCLGSNCSPSTAYLNAIPLSTSTVLRFYSVDQAGNNEPVNTANYQIEPRYITLSPGSVNMGAALFYYPVSRTVTIENSGSMPVTVSAPMSVTGPDSAMFRVAPGGPAPCSSLTPTIAAGQSCTMTVTFAPESAGLKQAYFHVSSNADNTPVLNASLTGMGLPPLYLTMHITGGGSVNNIAQTAGFSCDAPSCTAPFAAGTSMILRATPSSGYTFSGWSGEACIGMGDCELALTSNTTVAALFAPRQLVRINSSNAFYPNFTDALEAALNLGVLRSRNVVITDNIDLGSAKTVTLIGGLKDDFATREGVTVLNGTITIRQGCLRVKDVIIR